MLPLAYHFGLHPWDADRLTITEYETFRFGLIEMVKQGEKANKEPVRPPRKR